SKPEGAVRRMEEPLEVKKLGRGYIRRKHLFKQCGVLIAHARADHGSDIAMHRIANLLAYLLTILVRQEEIQAIFADLRQGRSERDGAKILELISHQQEIPALLLWSILPLHHR